MTNKNEMTNWWFACDVTTAMLVVKNKNISLLWELILFSFKFLEKNFYRFDPPTWSPCHVVANQEY